MIIKDLPESERPREKAQQFGVEVLSNTELVAIVLRQGTKGVNSMELAQQVLYVSHGIHGFHDMTIEELMKIKGIKKAKAVELMAIIELSKRVAKANMLQRVKIESPTDLVQWLQMEIGYSKQEHFYAVYLDTKNHIIHYKDVFVGSLDHASVHPREIYKEAYRVSAAKLIVVHNHPSGDTTPSRADVYMTNELKQISQLMRIPLLDHIIVSNGAYYSFQEHQDLSCGETR